MFLFTVDFVFSPQGSDLSISAHINGTEATGYRKDLFKAGKLRLTSYGFSR